MAKILCDQTATVCPPTSVVPGVPVTYKLTLSTPNTGTPTVIVTDTLPTGFVVPSTGAVNCSPVNTGGYQIVGVVLTIYGVPLQSTTVCTVTGAFTVGASQSSASNQAGYAATGNANVPLATSPAWTSQLTTTGGYPNDLSIVKTASTNAVNVSSGPQNVTYTIKVKNNGPTDAYLGPMLRIEDRIRLRSNSVPLKVTYVSSTCSVPAPNDCVSTAPPAFPAGNPLTVVSTNPTGFVGWRYAPGSVGRLNVGATMTITYVMKIERIPGLDCILILGADGTINDAHIALNLPATTTGGPFTALADPNPANDTSPPNINLPGFNELHVTTGALVSDPACGYGIFPATPAFKLVKIRQIPSIQLPGGFPWGTLVYKITLQNISGFPVKDIVFEDWVQEGPGTPPFTAEAPPPQPSCAPPAFCASDTSMPPQNLTGYGVIKEVFARKVFPNVTMANGQTFSFDIKVNYSNPRCDSYSTVGNKPVLNYPRITKWSQDLGGNNWVTVNTIGQGLPQWSFMKAPPKCLFKVTKSSTGTKIRFNQPVNYVVTYQSTDPQNSQTVGTVIDTVRLTTANYAGALNVKRAYQCTPTGSVNFTASGIVNSTQMGSVNYPNQAPGPPLQVVNTTFAQQGVRVFQNQNPVAFGPLASLKCNVTLWVSPPAPSDPYCATNGGLQNAAFLDGSDYFDPSLDWPPSLPDFFDQYTKRLPKCFDLAINKIASPLWTWQGANSVAFQLLVSNSPNADPIVPPGGPLINDTISPPPGFNLPGPAPVATCNPGGCVSQWGAPFPTGVHGTTYLRIVNLPPGATQSETYTVQNTPPHPFVPLTQICNEAYATMRPPPNGPQWLDFYWKNPSPGNPMQTVHVKTCIPVLQTGKILVHKNVTVQPGFTAPSIPFTVTTQCTNGSLVIPTSTATLTTGQSSLIQGIPVGSTCSTSEAPPPPPTPSHIAGCQLEGWSTPVITPNPLTNTSSGTATVMVTNHYGCVAIPAPVVMLHKTVTSSAPYVPPPPYVFPITVACQNPISSTTVNILGGVTIPVTGLTAGATCSTTEVLPGPIGDPVCASVGWSPPVILPNPFTVPSSGSMTINVQNHYGCLTPPGGTIYYKKSVTSMPGYTAPTTATFPVTLQCQNGSNVLPPFTTTVSASTTGSINNVPLGSACTTTETLPPAIPNPGAACQSIGWFPPVITPNPIASTTNNLTVAIQNKYGCLTPVNGTGNVVINKLVTSAPPWVAPVTSFTVTLSCPSMALQTITVVGGGSNQFTNIPGGFTCTVAEQLAPKIPTPACHHLGWSLQLISPNPVVVPTSGTVIVTVSNRFECVP
jgi:hypothetical protein